jgi:hypothetical protein
MGKRMTTMTMMIIYKLIKVAHMGFIVVMTPTLSRRFNLLGKKLEKIDLSQIKDL